MELLCDPHDSMARNWILNIQASTPETTTSDFPVPAFFQELPNVLDHCVKAMQPSRKLRVQFRNGTALGNSLSTGNCAYCHLEAFQGK
jgi:hypothetical protein